MIKELKALDKINQFCIDEFIIHLDRQIKNNKERSKDTQNKIGMFSILENAHCLIILEILKSIKSIDTNQNINDYADEVRKNVEYSINIINNGNKINVSPIYEKLNAFTLSNLKELETLYNECKETLMFKYMWKELNFENAREFVESKEFNLLSKHILSNNKKESRVSSALKLVGEDPDLFHENTFEKNEINPKS